MSQQLRYWLQEQLAARRWSQAELARRANLSPALVSMVLNGKSAVTLTFSLAVAEALHFPLEEVLHQAGVLAREPANPRLAEVLTRYRRATPEVQSYLLEVLRHLEEEAL